MRLHLKKTKTKTARKKVFQGCQQGSEGKSPATKLDDLSLTLGPAQQKERSYTTGYSLSSTHSMPCRAYAHKRKRKCNNKKPQVFQPKLVQSPPSPLCLTQVWLCTPSWPGTHLYSSVWPHTHSNSPASAT